MHSQSKPLTGSLCALGCEVLFGLSYVFTRRAAEMAGAFELLGWRFLLAFLVMTACVRAGTIKVSLKGRKTAPLLLVALFSPVLYFIGETVGIGHTSASESGVFLACIPAASLIASSVVLKKRPSGMQAAGIGVTLAGVLLTVFAAGASASLSAVGYVFLTLAVVSYALYSVFAERASEFSEAEITYAMLAAGAVVFSAAALAQSVLNGSVVRLFTLPFTNSAFLTAVLYQGIGCSILAFFLSNAAIARIGVNRTSSFIGVSTVVSMIAGVMLLRESLSAGQIAGAAIILIGVYTANAGKNK